MFSKDKVQLQLHAALLPKVVSQFPTNQDIFLSVFFPKRHKSDEEHRLHSLVIRRTLAFYVDKTKLFHKSMQLFIAVADRMKAFLFLLREFLH